MGCSPEGVTKKVRRAIGLSLLFCAIGGGVAGESDKGPGAAGLVRIRRGNIPLVISVPHGGRLEVAGVPVRLNGNTLRDAYTRLIGRKLAERMEYSGGGRPWVVTALFDRKYADVNRAPGERAWEHPGGAKVYRAYHRALQQVLVKAAQPGKPLLLIDLHGQSSYPADVVPGTAYGHSVKYWRVHYGRDPAYGSNSKDPQTKGLAELLRGRGYTVPDEPPRSLSGGYITRHYGKQPGVAVIQVELHRRLRFDRQRRNRIVRDLAAVLRTIMERAD